MYVVVEKEMVETPFVEGVGEEVIYIENEPHNTIEGALDELEAMTMRSPMVQWVVVEINIVAEGHARMSYELEMAKA